VSWRVRLVKDTSRAKNELQYSASRRCALCLRAKSQLEVSVCSNLTNRSLNTLKRLCTLCSLRVFSLVRMLRHRHRRCRTSRVESLGLLNNKFFLGANNWRQVGNLR